VKRRILALSRDRGSIQTILPVIAALNEMDTLSVHTFATRESMPAVESRGLHASPMDEEAFTTDPERYIRSLFDTCRPELILSGFSPARGPAPETPEQYSIIEAHRLGVPSLSIQDYWGMYAQRLSRDGFSLADDLIPTRLCVLDQRALLDLKSFGVAEHRMAVTHNPWLDQLADLASADRPVERAYRSEGIKVLLASQPLASMLALRRWPYDQYDIFECLLAAMPGPSPGGDLSTLQILLHPSEDASRWNVLLDHLAREDVSVELCPDRTPHLLRDVDYLVTSHSTLAYEALYFGTPCISLRPAKETVMHLWIDDVGLSTVFQDVDSLRSHLISSDPATERRRVLELKRELMTEGLVFSDGMATQRVLAEIMSLLENHPQAPQSLLQ
jgi:hypothetical protein